MNTVDIIGKKRDGKELSYEELPPYGKAYNLSFADDI